MIDIFIATTNPGKMEEFKALLSGLQIRLVFPNELGINLKVDETGATYAENALLKARAYCRSAGRITLADDSGLEVDALDGAPGIFSARYSPAPGATDADRRARLLDNLKGRPRPWRASFNAAVAIAAPASTEFTGFRTVVFDGVCPGEIIPDERGTNGFGYDPIFFIPEFGRTMAELSMEEKNHVSHRARALKAALPAIHRLIAGSPPDGGGQNH